MTQETSNLMDYALMRERAEAAEARAAQLEADLLESGKAYAAKCYTVTELQRINGELLAERDEYERSAKYWIDITRESIDAIKSIKENYQSMLANSDEQIKRLEAERDELREQLKQAQKQIAEYVRSLSEAFNEGDGAYRP